MADANVVIRELGLQLAQALIDKTIAQVEAAESRQALEVATVKAEIEELENDADQ